MIASGWSPANHLISGRKEEGKGECAETSPSSVVQFERAGTKHTKTPMGSQPSLVVLFILNYTAQTMDLVVEKREKFGKATAEMRRQGMIPGELYGPGVANLHLTIPVKNLTKVLKSAGETSLVTVVIPDGAKEDRRQVFVYDVQNDPVTDDIVSVDFYQVKMDQKIVISVPLTFAGEAPAIKSESGILVKAVQEIKIEALPADIPHEIILNLGSLTKIGQSIAVKDLALGAKVRVMLEPEAVIVTVTAQIAEEEQPVAEVN